MSEALRVGMNLLWLRPGVVGGSEDAAVGAVRALQVHAADEVEVHLYAQSSFRAAYPPLTARTPTTTCRIPGGSVGLRVVAESVWLPARLRRDGIDVAHFYGGVVPTGTGRGGLLTIHDVQPLETVAGFSPVKRRWLERMIPASVERATLVAVPSEFVRDRLVELTGADPAKVTVVPHVVDRRMSQETVTDPTIRRGERERVRRRYGLDGSFVLYPAITYLHKNHRVLIEAFARVLDVVPQATLVLAGGTSAAEDDVTAAIARHRVADRVRRIGRIPRSDLEALLREASVMAFPSRYEGFGLPVVEAFLADTPVVASDAGSLPEIVGDAGTLVGPDDVDGWVGALVDALEGGGVSEAATCRRAARAACFAADRGAEALVSAYRTVAEAER